MTVQLPSGLIFEIAANAEIEMKGNGAKRAIRCPFHDDRNASAFVSENNVFYCSVCTPGAGWSAKRFATRLGLDWTSGRRFADRPTRTLKADQPMSFGTTDATAVWRMARARARDDDAVEDDREVYEFLVGRGLMEATEYGVIGIVASGMRLPDGVAAWPRSGHRLVSPLFDMDGELVSLQSRSVRGTKPKTRAPSGGRLAGTVFADERGLAMLRGECDTKLALLGEGLTDFLALAVAAPMPVLCTPGTGNAVKAVGGWCAGKCVLLATDCDESGDGVTPGVRDALFDHGADRVLRVRWPEGVSDACEFVDRRGLAGLGSFLSRAQERGAS